MLDCLLFDGLRSVLNRLAGQRGKDGVAADVRRKLLETQARHRLGQIDRFELGQIESALLARIRERS